VPEKILTWQFEFGVLGQLFSVSTFFNLPSKLTPALDSQVGRSVPHATINREMEEIRKRIFY
jgi:hypothetical protein